MRKGLSVALLVGLAVGIAGAAWAQTAACNRQLIDRRFSGVQPWRADNAIGFTTTGLAVDADGAPNSYRVDGNGLSYTCDGVVGIVNGQRVNSKTDPAHWQEVCRNSWQRARQTGDYSAVAIFGFLTDAHKKPLVQKDGDPLPGEAYITTTTVTIPDTPEGTQRHWIDAVQIPYIVLLDTFVKAFHVAPGDLAVVYRPKNATLAFAVYGDGGDLGEGSVRLHRDLQNNPMVVKSGIERAKRGISDRVTTVVFPGKGTRRTTDAEAWRNEIATAGKAALDAWGGLERLRACAQ
jgi:hypothetical protein